MMGGRSAYAGMAPKAAFEVRMAPAAAAPVLMNLLLVERFM
jgi:hypothetical protein